MSFFWVTMMLVTFYPIYVLINLIPDKPVILRFLLGFFMLFVIMSWFMAVFSTIGNYDKHTFSTFISFLVTWFEMLMSMMEDFN